MKKQTKRLLWIGIPLALVLLLLLSFFLFVKFTYPNTTGLGGRAFIHWNEKEGMLFTPGGIWRGEIFQVGDRAYAAYNEKRETMVVFGQGATWTYELDTRPIIGNRVDMNQDNVFAAATLERRSHFWAKKLIVAEGITAVRKGILYYIGPVREIYLASTVSQLDDEAMDFLFYDLQRLYFLGDALEQAPSALWDEERQKITVYCRPGTSGWDDPAWEGLNIVVENFSIDWRPSA